MSTANATAGTAMPVPGLNPGQLVSAIDHLWMAARLIDTLRTELHVLPEEARVRTSDILGTCSTISATSAGSAARPCMRSCAAPAPAPVNP